MKFLVTAVLTMSAALADAVTDWNTIMRATLSAQNPLAQARFAAITHLAMFEAVNAITKDYQPYLGTVIAPSGASPDAAAVAAAHQVLRTYFPGSGESLDAARANSLAIIPDGPPKTNGIAVGLAAAAAMIARRANDGSATPMQYTPLGGIGFWQPTPPAFAPGMFLHWGKVTPFGILSPFQFHSKAPPALTSGKYRRDYNEVKEVGGVDSTARPQDRADVAQFAAVTSPVQLWNPVALQVSAAQGTSLSENARLLALLNMAMCDASITVFEVKYFYNFWRPVTAIRAGNTDGNPRTESDPDFMPFVTTPPYPSYPSGHGSLSNAARYVLERIFGTGRHAITLSNAALPGVNLHYKRFRQITDDIADARVYGGIHFRFEQDEAELLGRRVARYVHNNNLRCLLGDRCADCEDEDDQ
jgi:hypothetical protein